MKRKTPLRRTGFNSKPKRIKQVSDKKRKYRASKEGQEALVYMGKVKQLPCAVCGAPAPSEVHHVIHGRYGSAKASDFDTIPLCSSCHRTGPDAIHRGKESWRKKFGNDYDYIKQTQKAVGGGLAVD